MVITKAWEVIRIFQTTLDPTVPESNTKTRKHGNKNQIYGRKYNISKTIYILLADKLQ